MALQGHIRGQAMLQWRKNHTHRTGLANTGAVVSTRRLLVWFFGEGGVRRLRDVFFVFNVSDMRRRTVALTQCGSNVDVT